QLKIRRMEFDRPADLQFADPVLEIFLYRLHAPLAPGAVAALEFDVESEPRGFDNAGGPNQPGAANGTFFNSRMLPHFGYNEENQINDPERRRKYGLQPLAGMADSDDPEARRNPDFPRDSDWVDFEAEIGTSTDQIALAPGELVRQWDSNGRRYFH